MEGYQPVRVEEWNSRGEGAVTGTDGVRVECLGFSKIKSSGERGWVGLGRGAPPCTCG